MKRIIVMTSGKGGVGKTTCAVYLGRKLVGLGNNVLLIDGDVGLRNLDLALGLQDDVVYDFYDILRGLVKPEQAIIPAKEKGLFLLAAPQINTDYKLRIGDMRAVCEQIVTHHGFDYIIIDCPAGIGREFEACVAAADLALVVTTPDVVANRDADRAIGVLEKMGTKQMMLLINKVRGDLIRKGKSLNINEVIDILGIDALGIVPEDDRILMGDPEKVVYAGKAFENIARRLEGEAVPLLKLRRKR